MVSDCVMYEVIMFLYHFSKGEVLTLGRESTTVDGPKNESKKRTIDEAFEEVRENKKERYAERTG